MALAWARRYNTTDQTEFAMDDLWRLSAAEIATLIASKKISAKQAASAALARLDGLGLVYPTFESRSEICSPGEGA